MSQMKMVARRARFGMRVGPSVEVETTEELDVRPLLERGEEPFKVIMAAIARLPEQGALQLRTSFEPVPLYSVLARRGFSHSSQALAADDWEVIFSRGVSKEVPPPRCERASCQLVDAQPARSAHAGSHTPPPRHRGAGQPVRRAKPRAGAAGRN
jgi:uncharacterized protein (DUF2249 family)